MTAKSPTKVVARRVAGFLVDFVLTGAVYWGLFFLLAERRSSEPVDAIRAYLTLNDTTYAVTGGKAALFFLGFLVIGLAYWVVLPGRTGFTLGKAVAGVRLVKGDGSVPAGIGRSLVRQLLWIVDWFPYLIPGLTGFVVALTTAGNRRVGDLVAGTYVVRRQAVGKPLEAARAAAVPSVPVAAGGGDDPPGPNWYPDPRREARLRYWDGAEWTNDTTD